MKQKFFKLITKLSFLLILFTSLLQYGCFAKTTVKYPIEVKEIKDKKESPISTNYEFRIPINGMQYIISSKGMVECIDSKGSKTTFKLYEYSEDEFIILKLYYTIYQNDLILLYNVDNLEYGGGKITRIKIPGNVKIWDVGVPFLEINIIEDKFLYFTDSDSYFVSKFDLDSGKLIWQLKGLHNKYQIREVKKIGIKNNRIELTIQAKGKSQLKVIKINKENGKE